MCAHTHWDIMGKGIKKEEAHCFTDFWDGVSTHTRTHINTGRQPCPHTHACTYTLARARRFSVWGQRFFFGRCCQIRSSSEMHGTRWEHAYVHVHAHTSKYWGFLELCLQSIKVNSARTGFGQTNEYSWLSVCVCLYQRRGKSKLWVRKRRDKRITRFRAERGQDIRRGQEVEWYRSSHNSLGSRCTRYLLPPLQLYTPPPYMIQPSSSLSIFQLHHVLHFHSWQSHSCGSTQVAPFCEES